MNNAKIQRNQIVNLRLFDIDHCLFHQHDNTKNILQWLIPTNQSLFDTIAQDIENQYDQVIIALGSNRQDYFVDWSNPGGSFCPVLPIIQSYLQAHTGRSVCLDPILMADLYTNKPAGSSYHAILKQKLCHYKLDNTKFKLDKADLNLFFEELSDIDKEIAVSMALHHNMAWGGETFLKHDSACLDRQKVSLIYAHAHRVALLNHDAKHIFIDFIDDNLNILSAIQGFYTIAPDFLPKNVTLRLHQYPNVKQSFNAITGSGKTDAFYTWFMRYIALRSYKSIVTADDLKIGHELHSYNNGSEGQYMHIAADRLNLEKIRAFRDQEIPKLGCADINLSQMAVYTTAFNLYSHGLIPGEFVLTHGVTPGLIPATEIAYLKPIKERLRTLFDGYIQGFFNRLFFADTSKAAEIIAALLQCRDTTDMKFVIRLSRSTQDGKKVLSLLDTCMQAIQEIEQFILMDSSLKNDKLTDWLLRKDRANTATSSTASCLMALTIEKQLLPGYVSITASSQRVISSETEETLPPETYYSHQYFIMLRDATTWSFSSSEWEWYHAFSQKWAQQYKDMNCTRLHLIPISHADDINNLLKYNSLKHMDSRSRITIIGEHESGSEYFTCNGTKVHFTKIIDLLCTHAQSSDILLNEDNLYNDERALRINFISSTIHEPQRLEESLARKMFHYALHHPQKPLRIELSAPQQHCAAFLGSKESILSTKSNQLFPRLKWLPIYPYHKRYSHEPFPSLFTNEKVPHLSAHSKPPHRKSLFKIDANASQPGHIAIQEIEDGGKINHPSIK